MQSREVRDYAFFKDVTEYQLSLEDKRPFEMPNDAGDVITDKLCTQGKRVQLRRREAKVSVLTGIVHFLHVAPLQVNGVDSIRLKVLGTSVTRLHLTLRFGR